jgi:hypothetical protein
VRAALGPDHGGVPEKPGHARAVERRGHGEQAEVLAQARLGVERESEAEIRVEGALVEFVEDHARDPVQRRVREDHPREHALGDHLDPRATGDAGLGPDAQADRLADALAERPGHPVSGGPCGKTPGLEDNDAAISAPRG